MSSLFEQATRSKFRFSTTRGLVTTEDLWDLSLEELDLCAVALNRKIKATQEESFLTKATTDDRLVSQLEVLKRVIEYKQEQEELKKQEAIRKAQREKLLELIDQKQYQQLSELSVEELKEQLAQL